MLWEATLQSFQQCYKCDMCTVWFVVSLSFINMTLKSWNILVMSCPLVQYQAYNHLVLRNSDYKPDIALVSWHNICRVCIVHIMKPFFLKWLTKCNGLEWIKSTTSIYHGNRFCANILTVNEWIVNNCTSV